MELTAELEFWIILLRVLESESPGEKRKSTTNSWLQSCLLHVFSQGPLHPGSTLILAIQAETQETIDMSARPEHCRDPSRKELV